MMICYIGVGSNCGDRFFNIKQAIARLDQVPGIVVKKISGIYETEPQGGPLGQSDYYNLVVEIDSLLEPRELLDSLKKIEKVVGRKAVRERWAAREIDLDILLCGDQVIKEEGLEVPHPRLQERFFVLKPLNDLAAYCKHPVLKKTVKILLDQVNQRGRVRKIEEIVSID
jgi:2-amino-4-hydroxy-6-hydroxymethyldihydropteridine diphosphokinase